MSYSNFLRRSIIFSKPLKGKWKTRKKKKRELGKNVIMYVAELIFSWVAFEK